MSKKNTAWTFTGEEQAAPVSKGDRNDPPLAWILAGCREYKSGCQERLYKRFYGYALSTALAYCTTREDAVEVVNDSFIKVFRNIETYLPSAPFKPWLRRIVVNTAIDRVRSARRFGYRHHADIEDMEQLSTVDVESDLHVKQIRRLLYELPDLLRFVFNMYEIEGYSHREISEKLDIAESSSRTYLARAKDQLRRLYRNSFMDEP
ncbi:MAG: RNA polymerase sigma factor [Balneolaceae bacterium]